MAAKKIALVQLKIGMQESLEKNKHEGMSNIIYIWAFF